MSAHHHVSAPERTRVTPSGLAGRGRLATLFGAALCVLAVVLGFVQEEGMARLQHGWLLAVTFFVTLGLGGLFFVLVQYLVRAGWSVVVRRLAEHLAGSLPLMGLLLLPVVIPTLFGNGQLYHWADPHELAESHLLQEKAPYLNGWFLLVRVAIYVGVWTLLVRAFNRRSLAQDDTGDPSMTIWMQKRAAPSVLAFALTLTFFAFDMLMSLSYEWFSTIFGVYVFAGSAVALFATLVLLALRFEGRGELRGIVTTEHYHDLGKLLFAFVFFWGYIAFSQFMLIWYGDIPEETVWFQQRWVGSWKYVSLLLLFGHFLLPFVGLLSRHVKRNRSLLASWAVLLLLMHLVDLYWLIMPTLSPEGASIGLIDFACLSGVGGLFLGGLWRRIDGKPLVPLRDPRLGESLAFQNL
ncbi:MAG: quinol:cytochrome C oxidoreductase [Planctomycetes bacterium]|nr:quinol:cytochrome C oxidoreductase [Planctomycetota bacterium]MCB9903901.1 quinol:cytochrome C oxidoreductase [Planctomycetota bacterium]